MLHIACDNGDIELVKILFDRVNDKKIDVNATNDFNETPLHVACIKQCVVGYYDSTMSHRNKHTLDRSFGLKFSKTEVIKYLLQNALEFGINLDAETEGGDKPIGQVSY